MSNDYSERLGDLSDATKHIGKLNITSIANEKLFSYMETMLLIRLTEQAIAKLVIDGHIKCPCHLAVGQEAIPTGISDSLKKSDYVFGNHRSHGHYLALGSDLDNLLAEVLGKATGCSGGMGGSMHLGSPETGFLGSVPIVAGTIPVATGAALAAKMSAKGQIAVSYFGDGSTEEGGFHESMNIAAVYNLPILFVCENNLYSSHLDINLRQPNDKISRYAKAHCIKSKVLDGNDVVSVACCANQLIGDIRSGAGPAFLEVITYRWLGHVGADENIDVGVRRSQKDLDAWKKRDPIKRLKEAMIDNGLLDLTSLENMNLEIQERVDRAVRKAMAAPYPSKDVLMNLVYSG